MVRSLEIKPENTSDKSKNYRIIRKLASGGSGTVYLGSDNRTNQKFAIKCVKQDPRNERQHQGRIRQEIDILKSISHENIVALHAYYKMKDYNFFVMDYMDGGDILDDLYIKKRYTEKKAKQISTSVMKALCYCHESRIIHRDIKPENILIDKKGNVKIADFGLSTFAKTHSPYALKTKCGTGTYIAPEILLGNRYGTPVDMWGVGVLLYIMIGGYHPFNSSSLAKSDRLVKEGSFSFQKEYWGDVSKETTDFISKLLATEPETRITAHSALKSNWLNEHENGKALGGFRNVFRCCQRHVI